jgi:hypothetical protein
LALQPVVGFGLSNNISPFFPILQLSPSSHSQHLKISCCFLLDSIHSTSRASCNYQNIYPLLFRPSSLNLSSLFLCSTFVTISFLLCGVDISINRTKAVSLPGNTKRGYTNTLMSKHSSC